MDCKQITNLIVQIQQGLSVLERYLGSEQYEKAEPWIALINRMIDRNKEFFYWRKFERTASDKIGDGFISRIREMEKRLHPGFWPVRVSPNGKFLAYLSSSNIWLTRVNLETGEKVDNGLSNLNAWTDCSFFQILDDGSVILRGELQGQSSPVRKIFYTKPPKFKDDSILNLASLSSGECPNIFHANDVDSAIASYEPGELSETEPGFKQTERYNTTRRTHEPSEFVSINPSSSGRTILTQDIEGHLDLWGGFEIYLGSFKAGVRCLDYKPLGSDLVFVLTEKTYGIYRISQGEIFTDFMEQENTNKYVKLASDQSRGYLLAATTSGHVDVFKLNLTKPISSFEIPDAGNKEIKTFNVGINDKIIIGFADGEVAIFEPTNKSILEEAK